MFVRPVMTSAAQFELVSTGVFHSYRQLLSRHRHLVSHLHRIQQQEHPCISTISPALLDVALSSREAFLDYASKYPIAEYRIEKEKATNSRFKELYDVR
jgi:RHO1 GDP-GTP exchange protein 1/2